MISQERLEKYREGYINSAIQHSKASENGDYKIANKEYKVLTKIYTTISKKCRYQDRFFCQTNETCRS